MCDCFGREIFLKVELHKTDITYEDINIWIYKVIRIIILELSSNLYLSWSSVRPPYIRSFGSMTKHRTTKHRKAKTQKRKNIERLYIEKKHRKKIEITSKKFRNTENFISIHFTTILPGRVAQSVGHLTHKSGVLGSIPGLATYFRFSFRFFKKGSCQLLAKVCARSTG